MEAAEQWEPDDARVSRPVLRERGAATAPRHSTLHQSPLASRYLYRAIDRSGALVDVMFSEHRDMAAAKAFFESAKMVTGITPDRITTDGHDSYPRAIRTPWAQACGTATTSISTTAWSKIIGVSKDATVQCAGSSARDQPADFAERTMSYVTFSVLAPEPISQSPPTTAGSIFFAAPQRF